MNISRTVLYAALIALLGGLVPIALQAPRASSQSSGSQQISGRVIGISDDEFLLETSPGQQIVVEAEEQPLRQANLRVGERITVTGYTDEGEFEAYTLVRPGGTVIQVWD